MRSRVPSPARPGAGHPTALAFAAVVAGVASVATLASPALAQRAGSSALDRAVATYAHVATMRGTFEQTLTNPLTGTSAVARGEFVQERPSHLDVRFTDPSGDRIVADGRWVWVYVPSATPGQVMRVPVNEARSGGGGGTVSVDFISQLLTDPTARFTVTGEHPDTVGNRQTTAVTLQPRDPGDQITRATLWIDAEGVVRQFEVTDASGTARRIRLLTEAFNGRVDRSAFAFRPPPGVKVVDQSGLIDGAG